MLKKYSMFFAPLIIAFILPSIFNTTSLFAQLADSPWPMFRHDIQHTGRSPYPSVQKPAVKWIFQTDGPVTSSPAIGEDGTIYFGSKDKKLYAITRNGELKWAFETQGEVESSPAIKKDGAIFFGSWDNYLYALNSDGSVRW
ncbi:MAG: PQQ-binding-like beta-propeller repeat protein, partial [Planctomycetota bacterium]